VGLVVHLEMVQEQLALLILVVAAVAVNLMLLLPLALAALAALVSLFSNGLKTERNKWLNQKLE